MLSIDAILSKLNPASEDDDLWMLQKALGFVRFAILTNGGAGAV
jgi:hypothetical protein